ncbi:MAG: hypothetical protein LBN74_00535 [Prevotella sp.]|jgi:hypothetical protein|nr:hypothetical protein [Prevotella sp.]
MASVPRFYKSNIAEGKGILIFSIVLATLLRIVFTLSFDAPEIETSGEYLWQYIIPFAQNPLYSLIGSSAIVGFMAIFVTHINADFVLIRKRTLLPSAITILLFSCHPSFVWITPAYFGILFMLFITAVLFKSYNETSKALVAFKATFILALGSLFAPALLLYLPLLWIALALMRCFNGKSILASLLGLLIIYFPAFSFYLFTDNLKGFFQPFIFLGAEALKNLPFLSLDTAEWVTLLFSALLICIIIGDNYINRHKDKIKVRAYLSLLNFITIAALALFLFLNITPSVNLYISIGIGSMLLSHFFALADTKRTAVSFYFYMLIYIAVCASSFYTIIG